MAPIKLSRIVSCTSQDTAYPAHNLLVSDGFKKWATEKPGVTKATVILHLEEGQKIAGLDIGNNGSAFVEILVGISGDDTIPYENLIITSAFMTPTEARAQTNLSKIRMFTKTELCKGSIDKTWDRIKIICTQPYNKTVKFGLSMIVLHGEKSGVPPSPLPSKISGIKLNPDITSPRTSKLKKKMVEESPKEGRAASLLLSKLVEVKEEVSQEALKELKDKGGTPTQHDPSPAYVHKTVIDISQDDQPTSSNVLHKPPIQISSSPSPSSVPFSQLLSGVVFVMSGFQNPHRSDLRDLALSMGCAYRPDWCADATHLICAVPNTPKYNQVKGKGTIVKKEWLFECRRRKKRIPEAKYRMDVKISIDSDEDLEADDKPLPKRQKPVSYKVDSSSSDNETEKMEEDDSYQPPQAISSDESEDDVDEDSQITQTSNGHVTRQALPDISDSEDEPDTAPFDRDTDNECEDDVIKRLHLPPLPNFFAGHQFYIHQKDLDADHVRRLERYLVAYGGKLHGHMGTDVRFVITPQQSWDSEFNDAIRSNPRVKFVNCSWVIDCNDTQCAVDKTDYYLTRG